MILNLYIDQIGSLYDNQLYRLMAAARYAQAQVFVYTKQQALDIWNNMRLVYLEQPYFVEPSGVVLQSKDNNPNIVLSCGKKEELEQHPIVPHIASFETVARIYNYLHQIQVINGKLYCGPNTFISVGGQKYKHLSLVYNNDQKVSFIEMQDKRYLKVHRVQLPEGQGQDYFYYELTRDIDQATKWRQPSASFYLGSIKSPFFSRALDTK